MTQDKNKPVIQLQGVSKGYKDKQVLKSINLDIYGGQVIGYLGPNGAGKTTTVKILNGVIDEFYGKAYVCGLDVRENSLEVKKRIGYVPEVAHLYDSLCPMDYLLFIGRLYHMNDEEIRQKSRNMLTLLGLEDELNKPMNHFSKGMKQRVLITAGLIHNPEVIFLDEPMSGLDATSVVLIKEIIAQLAASGKTIFYCSHMMDVVEKVCDRIIILSEGSVVADGSFAELQKLKQESSLETIFTHITNQQNGSDLAGKFIENMNMAV